MLLAAGVLVVLPSSGLMRFFTWQNPATVPLVIGLFLLCVVVAGPIPWVEVECRDEKGAQQQAYFLDGSGGGLGRLFGGTERLRAELKSTVLGS
jgi:hypothetical protein